MPTHAPGPPSSGHPRPRYWPPHHYSHGGRRQLSSGVLNGDGIFTEAPRGASPHELVHQIWRTTLWLSHGVRGEPASVRNGRAAMRRILAASRDGAYPVICRQRRHCFPCRGPSCGNCASLSRRAPSVRLEHRVRRLRVPNSFANLLYALEKDISHVRARLGEPA